MIRSRTSWIPKLRPDERPRVVSDRRGWMLVPTPMLVARAVARVPAGRLITPGRLRDRLARASGAELTCPMTTGIFLSIIAGAAEEALASGRRPVAPYWRVVLSDGSLPPKFPPGRRLQSAHLRKEGHRVVGGRVADVEAVLVKR